MKNLIKSLALVGVLTVIGAARTQATQWPLNIRANPNPVCSGSTVTLTVDAWPVTFLNWWKDGVLQATTHPSTDGYSVTTPAQYSSASWGCSTTVGGTAYGDSVYVTVNSRSSTPSAWTGGDPCVGGTLSLGASDVSGATYRWAGPNGFTANGQWPTIPNVTVAATGTYSCYVTVSGCPESDAGTCYATINPLPTAGTITPYTGSVCYGSAQTYTLSGYTGGSSIQWYLSNDGGATYNPVGSNSATYTSPGLTANTWIAACVNLNGCSACVGWASTTITPYPAAGTAAADASTVCSGSGTTIRVSGNTPNTVYYWYSSPDDASWTYTGTANGPLSTGPLTATTHYLCVSYNDSCGVWSSTRPTVTVVAPPTAGTAVPTASTVCNGSGTTITLTGSTSTDYYWWSSTDGVNYTYTGLNPGQPLSTGALTVKTWYKANVGNGGLCPYVFTPPTSVDISPPSVAGTATPDASTVCSGSGTTIRLTGYTGSVQWYYTILWEAWHPISGATSATLSTGPITETITYLAAVVSGACGAAYTSSTVTVSDTTPPTITCPADVTVSVGVGCTATSVALGSPVTGDNCRVASVANNAPAAYPLGTNSVIWTVTDGSGNTATCTQKVIVRDTTPPTAIAPPDVIIDL